MRILFLQKRPLFPADSGGKIRTLNVLRHLARSHEVTYLCNLQAGEEQSLGEMTRLGLQVETVPWRETPRDSPLFYAELTQNLFSRLPYNAAKDYDSQLRGRAARLLAQETFDLLICDFVQMAGNAIGLDVPAKILFEHNVEAEIFRRHAETDAGWLRRRYMTLQWRKMQRFEADAGRHFDTVIAVSRRDQNLFESDYGWQHVHVIDTAVDLDYFTPQPDLERAGCVLFVGSMDWLPNQDGVRYFVSEVWDRIRQQCPQATFRIVGRNPPPEIARLAEAPGVEVVGTVPDVRPYLAEAAVVVVPLRIGGGTRLKIFEAAAMKKAVISTSLGAEGLDVVPGEHLLVADDSESFGDAVVELLDNKVRRSTLAARARELVVENYSSEAVAAQFEEICRKTVEQAATVVPAAERR